MKSISRGGRNSALSLMVALSLGGAPSATYGQLAIGAAPDRWEIPDLREPDPVSADEYAQRRAGLAESMEDGVFVAFGATEPEQDFLPYAQDANFRYLTGIQEPNAALIVVKSQGDVEEMLFVRARNPARELWEGARLGAEGAQIATGIPAQSIDRFLPVLESLVLPGTTLYTLVPLMPQALQEATLTREQQILRRLVDASSEVRVVPVNQEIRRLRASKSPSELDMIRRAVYVSALAHREAMRSVEPGMNEFEIQGLIEYYFRRHGAERPAFASIVASGPNSTTLHYRATDRFMEDGEVLLMDVGAAYQGYAADITRTIPVNGRFAEDQRAIYEIVLAAQKAAEEEIIVGRTWSEANQAANRVVSEGLASLGLIDAPDATYYCESPQNDNRCSQLRLFYMHSLGHGIGLNVHDPDISSLESFQIGSAFTIEPGIYVRSDVLDHLRDSPENHEMIERLRPAVTRYRDVGVRIEDVYIMTEDGLERVSSGIPREIDEIEALMSEIGVGLQNRRPEVIDWYRSATSF
jgi:Xaa-Pro aminopeptidase